jgi:serine/threonine protein phosphatase PrpC
MTQWWVPWPFRRRSTASAPEQTVNPEPEPEPEAVAVAVPESASEPEVVADVDVPEVAEEPAEFPIEFSAYRHVGPKPPSYRPEPSAAVDACQDVEGAVIPDTLVDGFTVGALIVRAASIAGDAHRYDGVPRQDALATAVLGPPEHGLVLGVVADGVGSQRYSHVGAAAACKAAVTALVPRSGAIEAALRGGLRDRLHYELVHIADEVAAAIEAEAGRIAGSGEELATTFRAVLVPTDPKVRSRLAFSVGDGATFRLAEGGWTRIRPESTDDNGQVRDNATAVLPLHSAELRVDVWAGDPGDTIVVCTDGFSNLLGEKDFASTLAEDWGIAEVPGMMRFLWQAQSRLRGYDDDRTVICIWERTTSPAA